MLPNSLIIKKLEDNKQEFKELIEELETKDYYYEEYCNKNELALTKLIEVVNENLKIKLQLLRLKNSDNPKNIVKEYVQLFDETAELQKLYYELKNQWWRNELRMKD
jgi:hypothetical protein